MEHLSSDHKVHLNQQENSHKPCYETWHPVLSLTESQWKLRQQHHENLPMEETPNVRRKKEIQKSRTHGSE